MGPPPRAPATLRGPQLQNPRLLLAGGAFEVWLAEGDR